MVVDIHKGEVGGDGNPGPGDVGAFDEHEAIEAFGDGGPLFHAMGMVKEVEAFGDSIDIEADNAFTPGLEKLGEGQLASDGIAIRAGMGTDPDGLHFEKGIPELFTGDDAIILFHGYSL